MCQERLAQIATSGRPEQELSQAELRFLHKGSAGLLDQDARQGRVQRVRDVIPGRQLDETSARQQAALRLLPGLAHLAGALAQTAPGVAAAVLERPSPERSVPREGLAGEAPSPGPVREALLRSLGVRAVWPVSVTRSLEEYAAAVFGTRVDWRAHGRLDLRVIEEADSQAGRPLLLCSEGG